jgi:hypothetical protein
MDGVLLEVQLVTSEPEAVDIPEAQPKQSLPYSFHVPATRHGIASVCPTLTKSISTSNHRHDTSWGFCEGFIPRSTTTWMVALILMCPPAALLAI